jgi:hypothetical protein
MRLGSEGSERKMGKGKNRRMEKREGGEPSSALLSPISFQHGSVDSVPWHSRTIESKTGIGTRTPTLRLDPLACGDKPPRSPRIATISGRIFAEPVTACCRAAPMLLAAASHARTADRTPTTEASASGVAGNVATNAPARRVSRRRRDRPTVEPVARRLLPREACASDPGDPYLSLRDLSVYSGICRRELREHIKDAVHPLPCFSVGGGKLRVRRSEFDAWMTRFRVDSTDVDAIVREVLGDMS